MEAFHWKGAWWPFVLFAYRSKRACQKRLSSMGCFMLLGLVLAKAQLPPPDVKFAHRQGESNWPQLLLANAKRGRSAAHHFLGHASLAPLPTPKPLCRKSLRRVIHLRGPLARHPRQHYRRKQQR